jgi:frataxin-like iron-binding protein CyaY
MDTIINEELARRNHENHCTSDYTRDSQTQRYYIEVAKFEKCVKEAMKRVKEFESKKKLENLLYSFKVKYANWINRHNSAGASHVSWFIAGRGNYNMNKHNKWIEKESKLMHELDEIMNMKDKINSIVNGDRIIKSGDSDALFKLKEKLEKAVKEHQGYKDYNIRAKKESTSPLPSYVLSNSNARIRSIKNRIEDLEKAKEKGSSEIEFKRSEKNKDIKIIDNVEIMRIQIIFPYKPDEEIRNSLKRNGFRYSPKNTAWQRHRNNRSVYVAKDIIEKIH